jgi:BirA family transcriptional regulator, biotin operon repressor / biotin---[acetyl-CoA-carboxylase] ligase
MSIDTQILTALRSAGNGAVSGAELSQRLGVSRTAIWARIEGLRTLGYEIAASPHQGYHLLGSPDLLHAEDLHSRLGRTRVIGREIRVFQETSSTSDIVEKLGRDGVKEGVVAFAESQTKGRGRLGRHWVSPSKKGLWFSVLLRPSIHPLQATQITVACATALRRAISLHSGLQPSIKWPNDVMINGRKVAGILTELNAELDHVKYLIAGIGVDVNQTASDFTPELRKIASSIRIEAGRPVPRPELAVLILQELDKDYQRVTGGRFTELADEWEGHCNTIGRDVSIRIGERFVRGRAEALGEDGALLVRTDHGHLERVIGGDVTLNAQ